VPWGLLYFGDTSDGAAIDPELFLGMRHVVEQIPLQTGMLVDDTVIDSGNPSLAVSVNVNADIDGGKLNLDGVAKQLAYWNDFADVGRHPTHRRAATDARRAARRASRRRAGPADVPLLSRGHERARRPRRHSQRGVPAHGRRARHARRPVSRVADVEAAAGNPLVFINACESAELRPEFYDGFIPYFMAKGARGVVGTECKTPAIFASEWALRFFPRFLDGAPLGDLFLELRREFHTKHGNPLGLLVQRLLRRRHPDPAGSHDLEGAAHAHPKHRRHRRAVLSPLVRRAGHGAPESNGILLSDVVRNTIADPNEGITDVFFASHGWKGDVAAAIEQYDRWVGEMARSPDRAAARAARPGFKSIVIGLTLAQPALRRRIAAGQIRVAACWAPTTSPTSTRRSRSTRRASPTRHGARGDPHDSPRRA
jgi:hypothetical protein